MGPPATLRVAKCVQALKTRSIRHPDDQPWSLVAFVCTALARVSLQLEVTSLCQNCLFRVPCLYRIK